jgi:hypothetical protein
MRRRAADVFKVEHERNLDNIEKTAGIVELLR